MDNSRRRYMTEDGSRGGREVRREVLLNSSLFSVFVHHTLARRKSDSSYRFLLAQGFWVSSQTFCAAFTVAATYIFDEFWDVW